MSFEYGETVKITLWGTSHGPEVGMMLTGLPAGESVDMEQVQAMLNRRAPGGAHRSARQERDIPQYLSGLKNNVTDGTPLRAVIPNEDVRSGDYDARRTIPRPSHADYAAVMKYGPGVDLRGGGVFSGRMTAPLCLAGAICEQILARRGITVGAHLAAVGDIDDRPFDPVAVDQASLLALRRLEPPVLDARAGAQMLALIAQAADGHDSVGGMVECAAVGLPPGLGAPLFGGLESRLAAAAFAIPAVKGIEFGAGFSAARMRGSEHNDSFYWHGGAVNTRTNRHGGILGGLSSGMPLLLRVAFKPTPSIGREQDSVDLATGENVRLAISGRHDPCIALRAVPVCEAVMSLVLLDVILTPSEPAAAPEAGEMAPQTPP
ncbi:MAG: chorismate synthase [Syntrophomonadaceae bacterium]|nr:chorismate synthase [Syntrophomonadaceae bacterium]